MKGTNDEESDINKRINILDKIMERAETGISKNKEEVSEKAQMNEGLKKIKDRAQKEKDMLEACKNGDISADQVNSFGNMKREKESLSSVDSVVEILSDTQKDTMDAGTITVSAGSTMTANYEETYNDFIESDIEENIKEKVEEIGENETIWEKFDYIRNVIEKRFPDSLRDFNNVIQKWYTESESMQYQTLMSLRSVIYHQILNDIPKKVYEKTNWYKETSSERKLKGQRAGQTKYLIIQDRKESEFRPEIIREINQISTRMQDHWDIMSTSGKYGDESITNIKRVFRECISDFFTALHMSEDLKE